MSRRRLGGSGELGSSQSHENVMRALEAVCVSAWHSKSGDEANQILPNPPNQCDNSHYRQVDGRCNNVRNPEWGATYSPFQRALSPDYADGE